MGHTRNPQFRTEIPAFSSLRTGCSPLSSRFPELSFAPCITRLLPPTLERGSQSGGRHQWEILLQYAIVFLVIALVAAAVGFGGVAGVAMDGARILFWVFIVLFVISLIGGLVRRG